MKQQLSLAARLAAAWFALVTVLVLGARGGVLHLEPVQQIRAHDDFDLMLTAQRLRRLTSELGSPQGIALHDSRGDSLVIGNQAFLLKMQDSAGRASRTQSVSLCDRRSAEVKAPNRILVHDVQEWHPAG